MAHQTGENEQALRKITDFTRMASVVLLVIHFYYFCHHTLAALGYASGLADNFFIRLSRTGLFNSIYYSKIAVIILLATSLLGVKGKKEEKINGLSALILVVLGLAIFLVSHYIFD
jgi:hypothetical protein